LSGPIISGDVLLASDECPSIARLCKAAIQKPIGIEMEGAGVKLAADRCKAGTGFLMIRGVSDFADQSKKSDEFKGRELATYTAASFAVEVIRSRELRSFLNPSAVPPGSPAAPEIVGRGDHIDFASP